MNSAVDICNLALGHLGVEPITDLNGTDKSSRTCNQFYSATVKYLLGQHFWNFAMKRVSLSKDAEAPAFGWNAQFTLPSDFLLLYQTKPEGVDYELEGGKLLCNQSTMKLKYVHYTTNVAGFDPAFIKALGYHLAMDMCWSLVQSRTMMDQLDRKFQEVIRNAKATDAISAPMNELIEDTFLNARISGVQPYGRF